MNKTNRYTYIWGVSKILKFWIQLSSKLDCLPNLFLVCSFSHGTLLPCSHLHLSLHLHILVQPGIYYQSVQSVWPLLFPPSFIPLHFSHALLKNKIKKHLHVASIFVCPCHVWYWVRRSIARVAERVNLLLHQCVHKKMHICDRRLIWIVLLLWSTAWPLIDSRLRYMMSTQMQLVETICLASLRFF